MRPPRRFGRGILRSGCRAYRVLLYLYPREFRTSWGGRIAQAFDRRSVRALRDRGVVGLLGWWMRAAIDFVRSCTREWGDASTEASRPPERSSLDHIAEGVREAGFSLRRLARSRGWTLTAWATLAIGVGAITGVFSLVHDSLVRPLPFSGPERLVSVQPSWIENPESALRFSLPLLESWESARPAGVALAGYSYTRVALPFDDGLEYIDAAYATGNLLSLLGVRPLLGRSLEPTDDPPGSEPVILLSEGLWRIRFGGDPEIVGQRLEVGDRRYTIVGVVGPKLSALVPTAQIWLSVSNFSRSAQVTTFSAVGRIPEGSGLADVRGRFAGLDIADGIGRTFSGRAEPLKQALVGDTRIVLLTFFAVVTGLLLVAGMNLANLFLVRSTVRSTDRTIRAALGAGRGRLLREAGLDGVVLGLAGGAAGVALARWLRRGVVAWSPDPIPGLGIPGTSGVEIGFALVVSVGLCVLLSTFASSGTDTSSTPGASNLRSSGRTPVRRAHRGLVMSQIAVTFVLLTASVLLGSTFARLAAVDPGFVTAEAGSILVTIPPSAYPDSAAQAAFTTGLIERTEALPGVRAAAAVDFPPLQRVSSSNFQVENVERSEETRQQSAVVRVEAGFFEVMGIPLLEGRPFDERDRPGSAPALVVSESFARRFIPDGNAVGTRIRFGTEPSAEVFTIIGISGDVRFEGQAGDVPPVIFRAMDQFPQWTGHVAIVFRTEGPAEAQLTEVRRVVNDMEPRSALLVIGSFEQWLNAYPGVAETRFRALVVGLLGAVSLLLALVGVYGVTAYSVRRRTRELGIRIALGSGRRAVVMHVLSEGVLLAGAGVLLGGVAAWLSVDALQSLLMEFPARDPRTFAAVAAILLTVGVVASAIPAITAARVEPVEALREE